MLRALGDRAQVRSGEEILSLRPKGLLRQGGLLAGDLVEVSGEHIVKVLPRRNELGRPPVANVALLVAVATLRDPVVQLADVERLLLQAAAIELEALVVLNKCDLASAAERDRFAAPLRAAGYRVLESAASRGEGIGPLGAALPQGLAVLAGPSGVGKSSLLSALTDFAVEVGAISARLRRGRHTTRAATLYEIGGGRLLADTPGFSALELPDIAPRALRDLYPEFRDRGCRFSDCVHRAEPDCGVRAAVSAGSIDLGRYERYLRFLEELEGRPPQWH